MYDFNELLNAIDGEEIKNEAANQQPLDDIIVEGAQNIDTFLDIVFCVDITSSMQPTIDTIKAFTTSLYDDLIPAMLEREHREVKQMRVKVIGFRDYYCDGDCSLVESQFFMLPQESMAFRSFVNSLEAKGGGDNPENSLEALALAMRTNWVQVTDLNIQRSRHVIVLFTDDSAHPLEQKNDGIDENYPSNMPDSLNQLTVMWQQGFCDGPASEFNMDKRAKRLIVFAPENSYPWDKIEDEWDNTVVLPMQLGGGGIDLARDVIINTIGKTI